MFLSMYVCVYVCVLIIYITIFINKKCSVSLVERIYFLCSDKCIDEGTDNYQEQMTLYLRYPKKKKGGVLICS